MCESDASVAREMGADPSGWARVEADAEAALAASNAVTLAVVKLEVLPTPAGASVRGCRVLAIPVKNLRKFIMP